MVTGVLMSTGGVLSCLSVSGWSTVVPPPPGVSGADLFSLSPFPSPSPSPSTFSSVGFSPLSPRSCWTTQINSSISTSSPMSPNSSTNI